MADYEDTKVNDLIINNMSQEKFDELKTAGELDPTQIYLTPTEESGGASLPDQTDNAGKFLTTDGTTASWGEALKNNTTIDTSVAILGTTNERYNYKTVVLGVDASAGADGVCIGYKAKTTDLFGIAIGEAAQAEGTALAIGPKARALGSKSVAIGVDSPFNSPVYASGVCSVAFGPSARADADYAMQFGYGSNSDANTIKFANANGNFEMMDANGNVPRERLKNLVEVLPTADNGYTTVKNFGNGYVEITGYASIGTVGAGTGSEVQIDLPTGYTMADANYWVNIAPTSETTMFDFKAEAKARSTTHFMVAYKNEDTTTGLTAAGVYWEVHGMLATTEA